VKNPSCESIEVEKVSVMNDRFKLGYKIIIPKEEPKQETLEEAAERYTEEHKWEEQDPWFDFMEGAKWQQERMYSVEDLECAWNSSDQNMRFQFSSSAYKGITFKQWLEKYEHER
jgi:hypothetical protein